VSRAGTASPAVMLAHHSSHACEIQVSKPHPPPWQADTLLGSRSVGGAAALPIAASAIATMLISLVTQLTQIVIKEAIGARSLRIARLYLATLTLARLSTRCRQRPVPVINAMKDQA
jgi:hypothetical protein